MTFEVQSSGLSAQPQRQEMRGVTHLFLCVPMSVSMASNMPQIGSIAMVFAGL